MDLIIGAGVSGISYATFTDNDYCMVEATNEIGGYCKTVKKENLFGITQVIFFILEMRD